jgi:hypothetical protein
VNIEEIEIETGAAITYVPATKDEPFATIGVDGPRSGVEAALELIADCRPEVLELCRVRQGIPLPGQEMISRRIPVGVESLDKQFARYKRWYSARDAYSTPSADQLALMRSKCAEGDVLIPNYALSFDLRKPDGSLVRVDRRGRVTEI